MSKDVQVRFLSPAQRCEQGKYTGGLGLRARFGVCYRLPTDFAGLSFVEGHFRKRGDKWNFWAELGTVGDGKRRQVSR